ncbi:MAG: hypothetical protein II943_07715 [Victivallales bacterium]|nr:hypothetical protein [Victivallales bacterium]
MAEEISKLKKEIKVIDSTKITKYISEMEPSIPSDSKKEDYKKEDYLIKFKIKQKQLLIKEQMQLLEMREKYAQKAFQLVKSWLVFIVFIILLQGVVNFYCSALNFSKIITIGITFLSDTIIIQLIKGTSISVIVGLFAIVLQYLFQKKEII